MKFYRCFPLIGLAPLLTFVIGILVLFAILQRVDMGDGPGVGVGVVMWQISMASCVLAIVIVLIGIVTAWRCVKANAPCGRVLVGIVIALSQSLAVLVLYILR
jgi:hypothetical protein